MLTDEHLAAVESWALRERRADVLAVCAEVRRLRACPALYPPFGLPADLYAGTNYASAFTALQAFGTPFQPAEAVTDADGFVGPPTVWVNPDSGDCDAPAIVEG